MGVRGTALLGLLSVAALTACGDQQSSNSTPTGPGFAAAAKPGSQCDFQAVQQAVNAEFTGATDVAVSKLATDMKNYRGAGDVSNATFVGYQILDSLAHVGRSQGTPAAGSTLAIALLQCMEIGGATIPASFTGPLGDTTGAFGVRGRTALDNKGLLSHDGIWGVEPQTNQTWRGITTTGAAVAESVAHTILIYGNVSSLSQSQFTNDTPLSSVYDWASIPIATFSPGVVVGECGSDLAYIQHNPASNGGEVLGFVPFSCTGSTALLMESTPRTLAERIGRLLSPEPAYAAALLGGGSGGTKGSFSPFGKIDPGAVNLTLLSQPSKSGNQVGKPLVDSKGKPLAVVASSNGGTQFKQPTVFAWLVAIGNNGSFVQVCNNWAYSDDQGKITFPNAFLNKAGGFTIVVRTVGTDEQSSATDTPPLPPGQQPTSTLFNVKNGTVGAQSACLYPNAFTDPATQLLPQGGPPPI
jgi:hypothetical protein